MRRALIASADSVQCPLGRCAYCLLQTAHKVIQCPPQINQEKHALSCEL